METQIHSGLLSPGGCLTARALQRYLNNTLRPVERLKLEEHLRHCLICSEAFEGFKRHRTNDFLQSDLEFLSGKIRKRYSTKNKANRGLPVYIVFTIIAFLIIIVVIFYIIRYLLLNQ